MLCDESKLPLFLELADVAVFGSIYVLAEEGHGMRKFAAYALMGSGFLAMMVGGIWGMILDLRILNEVGGFWLALAGFVLFPVLLVFAPFYSGIAWADWTALKVTYGFWIVAIVLIFGGSKMDKT